MAKKKKIDNSTLKRLYRKASQESRLFEVRDERQYFLIVCEGEKTEPGYFESLKSHLPNGILTINIIGAGDNTLNLVDIALGLREEAENQAREDETQRSYDQIWVVFDKDSFPAQRFNTAIFKANSNGLYCAYSNEAFELWFLLHFNFYDTGITRQQYKKKLSKLLGFKYHKNDSTVYDALRERGNESHAIRWARKLYSYFDHSNPAEENPSTTVFLLIEELNRFKKQ